MSVRTAALACLAGAALGMVAGVTAYLTVIWLSDGLEPFSF